MASVNLLYLPCQFLHSKNTIHSYRLYAWLCLCSFHFHVKLDIVLEDLHVSLLLCHADTLLLQAATKLLHYVEVEVWQT